MSPEYLPAFTPAPTAPRVTSSAVKLMQKHAAKLHGILDQFQTLIQEQYDISAILLIRRGFFYEC